MGDLFTTVQFNLDGTNTELRPHLHKQAMLGSELWDMSTNILGNGRSPDILVMTELSGSIPGRTILQSFNNSLRYYPYDSFYDSFGKADGVCLSIDRGTFTPLTYRDGSSIWFSSPYGRYVAVVVRANATDEIILLAATHQPRDDNTYRIQTMKLDFDAFALEYHCTSVLCIGDFNKRQCFVLPAMPGMINAVHELLPTTLKGSCIDNIMHTDTFQEVTSTRPVNYRLFSHIPLHHEFVLNE